MVQNSFTLGSLSNPCSKLSPSSPAGINSEILLSMLEQMKLIRCAEEKIAEFVTKGLASCPCHLAIGQEAIPVGISQHLTSKDLVYGGHRSHGHYLALGASLEKLFAEVLGRVSGCSKGMGGSMHLQAPQLGFQASVPIVGATIPIAVGAALNAKLSKKDAIALSYFGDGASEEGVFHESLNLAASQELPILFVCENNLYSSHLDISLRQPSDCVARFANAHCIKSRTIDGNDLCGVYSKAAELIQYVRQNKKPAFLEAVTYRWRGHVGPNEDLDVGVRRSTKDLENWKKKDPISCFANQLLDSKIFSPDQIEESYLAAQKQVDVAAQLALKAPFPERSQLHSTVFAGV